MPVSTTRTIGGALAALCVVAAARRARALGRSGAAAAWVAGTAAVAGAGWAAGGALVTFFAFASALARLGRRRAAHAPQERGNERDAVQVAANGGVATLAALGMATGAPADAARAVFYGSLAAAAADTWGTEGGRWSPRAPRRLLVGPRTPAGTSGGMTPIGTAASAAGAATIAVAAALDPANPRPRRNRAFVATIVAGVVGALADSLLGATVQEVRTCPACGCETELPTHCGVATIHARGWRWLDNDAVNAAATAIGGLVGLALGAIGQGRTPGSSGCRQAPVTGRRAGRGRPGCRPPGPSIAGVVRTASRAWRLRGGQPGSPVA